MIVIVIIFHIVYVIMSVIHGPHQWHRRTREDEPCESSRRELRQLKKYPRSRRQVEISEGVRRNNASDSSLTHLTIVRLCPKFPTLRAKPSHTERHEPRKWRSGSRLWRRLGYLLAYNKKSQPFGWLSFMLGCFLVCQSQSRQGFPLCFLVTSLQVLANC